MNRMIAWFATNHVAANLLMGFAVIAGLAALTRIPVKMYPDVEIPDHQRQRALPGRARPREVGIRGLHAGRRAGRRHYRRQGK